ncbi:MAG: SH3 domain-containing protein [Epulopiscium sp.]|nr:SH3 domain-containing protein [Candidatus Epulonipiscium sp.]
MRWNPSSPGYPQYATDVAWAIKQTANISRIYNLLDDFILIYDVPKYRDQPSSSGNKDAGIKIGGTSIEITASSLNVRTGAGTSYASIGGVKKGTVLNLSLDKNNKIISKNVEGHVWYQVIYANSIAWVSGGTNGTEYIKIIGK